MPSGEEPKVQQESTLSTEQQRVADLLGGMIETGLEGGVRWPDFGVAQMGDELAVGYEDYLAQENKWRSEIDQTLASMIAGEPAFEFPFDKAAEFHESFIATPAIESFTRNVQPIIEESFGDEFYNSRRRKEVTNALTNVAAGLNKSLFETQMMGLQLTATSEENAANKQLTAMAMAQSQPFTEFQQLASAAGTMRGAEETDINALLENWARGLDISSPYFAAGESFIGKPHVENIAFQGQQSPWDMVGPALGVLGSASLMGFSDISVKRNLEPIDNALEKVSGLTGYTYNYVDNSNVRNGGIIAQDLEAVLPDAVIEINGVKLVKYDAVIGLLINALNELAQRMIKDN